MTDQWCYANVKILLLLLLLFLYILSPSIARGWGYWGPWINKEGNTNNTSKACSKHCGRNTNPFWIGTIWSPARGALSRRATAESRQSGNHRNASNLLETGVFSWGISCSQKLPSDSLGSEPGRHISPLCFCQEAKGWRGKRLRHPFEGGRGKACSGSQGTKSRVWKCGVDQSKDKLADCGASFWLKIRDPSCLCDQH